MYLAGSLQEGEFGVLLSAQEKNEMPRKCDTCSYSLHLSNLPPCRHSTFESPGLFQVSKLAVVANFRRVLSCSGLN